MNLKQRIAGARHEHQLPRVGSFSTYLMRGAALVLLLSVVGLPVNFALGGNSTSAVSVFLEAGDISSLLCLGVAALAHRGEKKAIRQILTEKQTIHWTYSPAEWQHYTMRAWRRSMRSNLLVTGTVWAILVVVFLASSASVFLALALGTGSALLLGMLLFLLAAAAFQWRRRHTPADVYISRAGIILCGWYYSLGGWMGRLKMVHYKAGAPGVLFFDIGSGRGRRAVEVPVPHGREAEAQQLTWRRNF